MRFFVSNFRLSYVCANVLAIAMCSLANFWASDRLVFCQEYRKVALGLVMATVALPTPALHDDIVADNLIRSATEATYMLRLSDARAAAQELQRRNPDHPAGFLIEAETYWWEAQEDPGNHNIENDYYRAQELAQRKGERAIQVEKYYKPELLAYLASAYGSYARFQVTQKNAYFSALRAGLRAHDYAEQVYALDKNYYDIYVGLGAFNYFTGTLPAALKPFASLLGARGDKDLGVTQLRTAMERARHSRTEARIVYYSALLSTKEYAAAFAVLEGLMSDYPDNFVLYDWAEAWFHEQNKAVDGTDYFEQVYKSQVKRSVIIGQYGLLEKAALQLAAGLKPSARQTLQRLRAIGPSDALISRKIIGLERSAAP